MTYFISPWIDITRELRKNPRESERNIKENKQDGTKYSENLFHFAKIDNPLAYINNIWKEKKIPQG